MSAETKLHPVGTRIRFTKKLATGATGDHPALLFAEKGEIGEVTGHGAKEGYLVKTDNWDAPFGASEEEFEVLP